MKRFFSLLGFLLLCMTMSAQVFIVRNSAPKKDSVDVKRYIRLHGNAYDSFTKAALGPHVTLMKSDSTVMGLKVYSVSMDWICEFYWLRQ